MTLFWQQLTRRDCKLICIYKQRAQFKLLKSFVWREPLFILRICESNAYLIIKFDTLLRLFGCERFSGHSRKELLVFYQMLLLKADEFPLPLFSQKWTMSISWRLIYTKFVDCVETMKSKLQSVICTMLSRGTWDAEICFLQTLTKL